MCRAGSLHAESLDALEDFVGGLGPYEGPRIEIVGSEVVADGLFEIDGAAMSTSTNLRLGERCEPVFDLIEPRGGSRGEVRRETRMAGHPGLHRRGLVGAVVVHHQMHIERGGRGGVNRTQEGKELLGPMPSMHIADDFARGDVKGRKQGRGAVVAVIMSAPLRPPRHHRQNRLRAVKRPNLTFLVSKQHQGAIRRIEVQPHHIAHLFDEQRVCGELAGSRAVRLQAKGVPDTYHRALRQSRGLGHHPAAPVRGLPRLHVQRLGDHPLDLTIADGARGAGPRQIVRMATSSSAIY